jgi:hypothetical protein
MLLYQLYQLLILYKSDGRIWEWLQTVEGQELVQGWHTLWCLEAYHLMAEAGGCVVWRFHTKTLTYLQKPLRFFTFHLNYHISKYVVGVRGGTVGWGTALRAGSSRVRFPMVSSFRSHYGPEVDLAYNSNEYQEYFLGVGVGVKAAGA